MTKKYKNAKRTDAWIRKAFIELVNEKKDIEKITVTELCKRADITKTTFYYHYQDIYSVADEYEDELIAILDENLEQVAIDNFLDVKKRFKTIIDYIKKNENSYRMVINSSSTANLIEKLKKIISNKIFEKVKNNNFLSKDKDEAKVVANILTNAFVETLVSYFQGLFNLNLDEVSNIILSKLQNFIS